MRSATAVVLAAAVAACAGGRELDTPSAASFGATVRVALHRGDVQAADESLQRGRRAHPEDAGLREWQALLSHMRWRDVAAIELLRAVVDDPTVPETQRREAMGRLGELLFRAGRYSDAVPFLEAASRDTQSAERRARLSRLARRLPTERIEPDHLAAELPLLDERPPELLCTVGDREQPFVLDTGASFTTLSRSLAAQLRVEVVSPAEDVLDGAGNRLTAAWGVLPELALGAVPLGPQPVLVVDDRYLRLRDAFGGLQRATDGLIGLDLLARFRVTFDPTRNSVLFGEPSGLDPATSVECVRHEGSCLVPVEIEGAKLWFVLDTGASRSSLSQEGLASLQGGDRRAVVAFQRVLTPGGSTRAVRSVPDLTLTVGAVRFAGVELLVVQRPRGQGFPIHGVLGADLVMRCRTTFDRGRLRFEVAGE